MKKKAALAGCALALLLAGDGAWYSRPMTIQQLCPEIDLSQCSSITAYFETVPSASQERLVLEGDSPAFSTLLEELQSRTFSRSLTSLLPRGNRSIRVQDGDFQWEIYLNFEEHIVTADGNGHSGMLITLRNFFGSLSLTNAIGDRTWNVTTQDQETWLSQTMDILSSANG